MIAGCPIAPSYELQYYCNDQSNATYSEIYPVPPGTQFGACYTIEPMNGSVLVMICTLTVILLGAVFVGCIYYYKQGTTIVRADILDGMKN